LAKQSAFQSGIEQNIPRLIGFLSNSNQEVRSVAVSTLVKLSEQSALQSCIYNGIVVCLTRKESDIPSSLATVISQLLSNTNFWKKVEDILGHEENYLSSLLQSTTPEVVMVASIIIAKFSQDGLYCNLILPVVLYALDSFSSESPRAQRAGLLIMETLMQDGSLRAIVHEIGAIHSFLQNFMKDVSLQQTRFFVEQMVHFGVIQTL